MNEFFAVYSRYEDALIVQFSRHPFFVEFSTLTNEEVIRSLLQLGHLSTSFVPWYEKAKLGLGHEGAKEVLLRILQDEIPPGVPTHQDNRLHDLVRMGISKERCLREPVSNATARTVKWMRDLTRFPQEDYDLRTMIVLRVAGEALVGETYRSIVTSMERRFGLRQSDSRFFMPHFVHDKKVDGGQGHTNVFDPVLDELIHDDRTLKIATRSASQAFFVRYQLFDQFVRPSYFRRMLSAIAYTTTTALNFAQGM